MSEQPARMTWVLMGVAALILCGPLLYWLTDLAVQPVWWRFTRRQLFWAALYGGGLVAFVASYRWPVPGFVASTRALVLGVAATLLATGLLGEIVLCWMEPPTRFEALPFADQRHAADPDVGHVFVPNVTRQLQTTEFRSTWKTNGEGVRADRDYGPKPPGVFRVLVIGDSFTAGGQVDLPETYPGVLDSELAETFGRGHIEVVNAGHPAYGTVHAQRWVEKFAARFEPDVIVHGMTPNDLVENLRPELVTAKDGHLHWKTSTPGHKARYEDRQRWYSVPGWLDRSALIRRINGAPAIRQLRFGFIYPHRHVYQAEQDETSLERYAIVYENLERLQAHTEAQGARLAIAMIPFREQLTELRPGLDAFAYARRITAWATPRGVPVIDTLPAFRAHPSPQDLFWQKDAHCTAAGYRLVGETLAEGLLANASALGFPAEALDASEPMSHSR
ncbi:MAG: hypothetical protein GY937_21490 [bacterium]|nr:hypothetical protein [bacterium]